MCRRHPRRIPRVPGLALCAGETSPRSARGKRRPLSRRADGYRLPLVMVGFPRALGAGPGLARAAGARRVIAWLIATRPLAAPPREGIRPGRLGPGVR